MSLPVYIYFSLHFPFCFGQNPWHKVPGNGFLMKSCSNIYTVRKDNISMVCLWLWVNIRILCWGQAALCMKQGEVIRLSLSLYVWPSHTTTIISPLAEALRTEHAIKPDRVRQKQWSALFRWPRVSLWIMRWALWTTLFLLYPQPLHFPVKIPESLKRGMRNLWFLKTPR